MEEKPRNDFFPNGRRPGGFWAKPGGLQGAHKPPLRHQGEAAVGRLVASLAAPDLGLWPINSQIFRKKSGEPRKYFSAAASFVSAGSHLETLPGALPEGTLELEGFYINIIASPMTCE